jgi:hypothetical protein
VKYARWLAGLINPIHIVHQIQSGVRLRFFDTRPESSMSYDVRAAFQYNV